MTADPLADYLAQDAAEALSDQARAEALLLPYRDNADAVHAYEKVVKPLRAQIMEYHQLNPDTELVDQEHGLVAKFVSRKLPGHKFDLVAIIENNPALFARLISVRALRVDYDAAIAADLGGEIKKYEVPAGETTALIVVRQ